MRDNSRVIYIVTKNGKAPNEKGADIFMDIYREMNPNAVNEPIAIISGPHLNNPAGLAAMLDAGRKNGLVIVVLPDEIIPCKTGPGPDGLAAVIGILRENIEKGYGQTSWEALSQSILENRK